MLNTHEGEEILFEGRSCIRVSANGDSHAVFGPYKPLGPGSYLAEYWLAKSFTDKLHPDRLCAVLDIAADDGRRVLTHQFVFASQLTEQLQCFRVSFTLTEAADRVEFRIRARGDVSVIAADDVSVCLSGASSATVSIDPKCSLAQDTPLEIIDLFKHGYEIRRADTYFLILIDGIIVAADERDDINFLGEVFEHRAYNIMVDSELCVIDIGMNVGLTSLLFASKANVKEVHSFEPFPSTFAKAERNLALNSELARKITCHNVGLSNRDVVETILVPDTNDSGSRATISIEGGTPLQLILRNAGSALTPIIATAKSQDRDVILKVDCEGSEFAIFDSLANECLLDKIDAYLVEWHAMFADKAADDLTTPLLKAGFAVIDLLPPVGNGFFYAIRRRRDGSIKRRFNIRQLFSWRQS